MPRNIQRRQLPEPPAQNYTEQETRCERAHGGCFCVTELNNVAVKSDVAAAAERPAALNSTPMGVISLQGGTLCGSVPQTICDFLGLLIPLTTLVCC